MTWQQVQHDQIGHAGVLRHVREEVRQRFHAAGRCADADDPQLNSQGAPKVLTLHAYGARSVDQSGADPS